MDDIAPQTVVDRYTRAKERRSTWEAHWQECYDYALPLRDAILSNREPGEKKSDKLFDGTAPDAVDQLAASMLSQLTPPWSRWFGLAPGRDIEGAERDFVAPELEKTGATLQSHFDRSNFAVEIHQCYLDLVTAGTACLLFEEAPPGAASAFQFTAVPLGQVVFEEDAFGRLTTTFRRSELTLTQFRSRFPKAQLPEETQRRAEKDLDYRIALVEAVVPDPDRGDFLYMAVAETEQSRIGEPTVLEKGRFASSPFINFRWLKAPGEVYGRSPVMKTLPDIKTANKVVELVLKNASIAVTGIWQADDDGVLNPANIKLVPGAIIPKAVGSAGLTPLEAPGRFDISQLVLDQLHARIRQALLADRLGQIEGPKMTATEVLERAAEMARILGATYGRLQSELLTPLVARALAILSRRGEVLRISLDGRTVDLEYKSPLARHQAQNEAQNTLLWLNSLASLGPQGAVAVDHAAAARWLGRAYGVPGELIREADEADPAATLATLGPALAEAPQGGAMAQGGGHGVR
ncbi:MAG: portal protein [Magnetospirillum sp. WYHS-4]